MERSVDVEFQVHHGVDIPKGSTASVQGLAMLGNVILDMTLGSTQIRVVPGGRIHSGTHDTGLDAAR
jgi:ABC-type transporter Mla subunit MlaD